MIFQLEDSQKTFPFESICKLIAPFGFSLSILDNVVNSTKNMANVLYRDVKVFETDLQFLAQTAFNLY